MPVLADVTGFAVNCLASFRLIIGVDCNPQHDVLCLGNPPQHIIRHPYLHHLHWPHNEILPSPSNALVECHYRGMTLKGGSTTPKLYPVLL